MKNYIYDSTKYSVLLESYTNIEGGNAEDLIAMGGILMDDGNVVEGSRFVDLVNSALMYFKNTHPYEYKYIRGATIVYLLDDYVTPTMCVSDNMIYCINVGFLYNKPPRGLNMSAIGVFRCLYHEAMHSMLAHISRMHAYNAVNTPKATWGDLNIAGDLEINGMMVSDGLCNEEFWPSIDCWYEKRLIGIPMETIIKDFKFYIDRQKKANAQKQQRQQQKQQQKQQQQNDDNDQEKKNKIPTSVEWKDGHRDGRELVRQLYKANKRNATKTFEELESLSKKYGGDMSKVAEELRSRFGAKQ
jgi:hypothetical protein